MAKNMLTKKETTLISDLLTMEALTCKKARLFSRTLTNEKLTERLNAIADGHEARFLSLLGLL